MCGKKTSGAQNRKRKANEKREGSKSSKLMECFLKKVKPKTEEDRQIDIEDDTDVVDFDQPSADGNIIQQNQKYRKSSNEPSDSISDLNRPNSSSESEIVEDE